MNSRIISKLTSWISSKEVLSKPLVVGDDEAWVNDRMERLAATAETADDVQNILLEGMSDEEIRAFCLGVRAGKHASARLLITNLSDIVNNVVITIDPYRK